MQPSRITLLVSSALAGTLLLTACGQQEQAQAPAQQMPVVGVVELKSQTITVSRELPGRVSAFQIAEIRPQVSGIIAKRNFTEGSEVKAGDSLYQIESAPFDAVLESAKAAVERAKASVASTEPKFNRYKKLFEIKAISQQELDEAQSAYLQAKAELVTAQAQVKTAQINVGYSQVKAPLTGQISKSTATVGALVTANQATPLTTITRLDPIYVDVVQSSSELLELKKALASGALGATDAKVQLTLEDGSTYAHEGRLQFSDVIVNPETGSVTLRAEFPNPEKLLLPGMYVRAVVPEGVKTNAILAPQRGVNRTPQGKASALVLNSEGKVEPRILETSRTVGSEWLVTSGLNAGDKLIVEGLQKIRPGAPATAVPAESTPSSNLGKGE